MVKKVAVVGGGISGLVCAHHLSEQAEVHVFEAGSYIGGHTNTLDVSVSSGTYAVDTGFIVFNDRTYPRFIRLMNKLNVASQPSVMSFSVKVEDNGLEYNGTSINTLFAQRRNLFRPSFYKMISDILRFNKEAPRVLDDASADISLDAYLKQNNYSRQFMDHYIIPMGAAIWSAGVAEMRAFPLRYFVRFFKNHGMLSVNDRPQWRVIKNGSRSYIPALTKSFKDRLHVSAPVRSVRRDETGVTLNIERGGKGEDARFDEVIMAGHADQSLALLSDATPLERDILSAFPYQENKTILHTDTSVLPRARAAWASWNFLVPKKENSTVAVTYDMNILQSIHAPETFLVSLNMEDRIDPAKILRKITYHHPIYSARAVKAQGAWEKVSGVNRTHYCGAYWGYGFHEDGVASAERVCERMGVASWN
jgi:predicted NAD/FAD-binding protein